MGRVVAVADVFDALSSKRVYKDAMDVDKTIGILKKDAGSHFDPDCVQAFTEIMDEILAIRERYQG